MDTDCATPATGLHEVLQSGTGNTDPALWNRRLRTFLRANRQLHRWELALRSMVTIGAACLALLAQRAMIDPTLTPWVVSVALSLLGISLLTLPVVLLARRLARLKRHALSRGFFRAGLYLDERDGTWQLTSRDDYRLVTQATGRQPSPRER